jgi:hypothetical protein
MEHQGGIVADNFTQQHPPALCYNSDNQLVIGLNNVEVTEAWRYKNSGEWCACRDKERYTELVMNGYEVMACYLTVPPTEPNKTDMSDVSLTPVAAYYQELGNRMMGEAQPVKEVDKDALSKAKDLAAQKHGYADWYQIECQYLEWYEKDGIRANLIDDVALFYHSQFATEAGGDVEALAREHVNNLPMYLTNDRQETFYETFIAGYKAKHNNLVDVEEVIKVVRDWDENSPQDEMTPPSLKVLINQIKSLSK